MPFLKEQTDFILLTFNIVSSSYINQCMGSRNIFRIVTAAVPLASKYQEIAVMPSF